MLEVWSEDAEGRGLSGSGMNLRERDRFGDGIWEGVALLCGRGYQGGSVADGEAGAGEGASGEAPRGYGAAGGVCRPVKGSTGAEDQWTQ